METNHIDSYLPTCAHQNHRSSLPSFVVAFVAFVGPCSCHPFPPSFPPSFVVASAAPVACVGHGYHLVVGASVEPVACVGHGWQMGRGHHLVVVASAARVACVGHGWQMGRGHHHQRMRAGFRRGP